MRSLVGEWWITSTGRAIYADGDIGDINHSNLIAVHCMRKVLRRFKASDEVILHAAHSYLEPLIKKDGVDIIAAREEMINLGDRLQRIGHITPEQDDDFFGYLQELSGCDKELLDCVFDVDKDLRLYGVDKMRWHRVEGNNLDIWELTRKTLRTLSDGLWQAYNGRVEGQDFNIEVRSERKMAVDVPWTAIAAEDVKWIRRDAQVVCS